MINSYEKHISDLCRSSDVFKRIVLSSSDKKFLHYTQAFKLCLNLLAALHLRFSVNSASSSDHIASKTSEFIKIQQKSSAEASKSCLLLLEKMLEDVKISPDFLLEYQTAVAPLSFDQNLEAVNQAEILRAASNLVKKL